jgi:hypothetical protein
LSVESKLARTLEDGSQDGDGSAELGRLAPWREKVGEEVTGPPSGRRLGRERGDNEAEAVLPRAEISGASDALRDGSVPPSRQ